MEPAELQAKRTTIGILALLLLCLSGVIFWVAPHREAMIGSTMRVGVLLSTFWLAIPQLLKKPKLLKYLPWYLLAGMVVIVMFAKYVLVLIPAFIALAILAMFAGKKRPEPKNGPR